MRPRNTYIERLKKRQEAAKSAGEPKPETTQPEELPTDPAARAEYLSDELREARQELERERAARLAGQRRAEQQARPSSLRDFLRMRQIHKRRSWR